MIPETRKRFERLIKATGAASEDMLAALADAKDTDLPSELVAAHGCDKIRVLQVLAEVYRVPAVRLDEEEMEKALLREAKIQLWRRSLAVPLRQEEGHVLVAMADPEDLALADEIQAIFGQPLRVCVTLASDILQHLDDWGGKVSVGSLVSELTAATEAAVKAGTPDHPRLKLTSESEASSPAVRLLDGVVEDAVARTSREIYLLPMPDGMAHVRLQVERKIVERKTYPMELHAKVVNRLRVLADLVGKDKRVPQRGAYLTLTGGGKHRVDVMIVPSEVGDAVTLFVDREDMAGPLDADDAAKPGV